MGMNYLSLAIFLISSAIHLYACYKGDRKLCHYTKPFIMLSILGWYCFGGFSGHGATKPEVSVIIAILLGLIGDCLLMKRGHGWFAAGGVSFGLSLILYSVTFLQNTKLENFNLPLSIVAAVIYCIAVVYIFRVLFKYLPKVLILPMFVYLLVNGMMNCFAFMQLYTVPCAGSIITFIGAVFFFVSDSILFLIMFKAETDTKKNFYVMITYILAQFMIVQGIMMIP